MSRRADPKSLSDEDLAQISAAARGEEGLFAAACLGSAVALPLLILASLIFGGAVQFVFLGVLLVLLIIFYAHDLLDRFKRPYRDELAYRYGQSAFSRYVEEAQATLGQLQADWIILFTATGLPHGDHRWLRLELHGGALPAAQAELRVSQTTTARSCTRIKTDVPRDAVKGLLSMLQAPDLNKLTDFSSLVIDGLPSSVAILRRDPLDVTVASCNLAFDDGKEVRNPTARICAKLYDITLQMTKAGPAH